MIRDPDRRYDGQADTPFGMDSGNAANSIMPKQVAMAVNCTFRSKFPATRPPFFGRLLSIPDETTRLRFNTGLFQGATYYQSDGGHSDCFLVMRGGRLFRIDATTNAVTEITPHTLPVLVSVSFTVPPAGTAIQITLNDNTEFTALDNIVIDAGDYTVSAILANNAITAIYLGGGTHATVDALTSVLDINNFHITTWDVNSPNDMFAWLFQAENYAIVLQESELPYIYDGTSTRRSKGDASQEIPAGYVGAYINGRIWLALPNRRFYIAGDLVGDRSSGTFQFNYVDSVLRFTSNTIINEGGAFSTLANSGPITSIISNAQLDASLGQGPVAIYTTNSVFINQAPVDAAIWKDIQYPIQVVAQVDYGALGPRSVTNVNADTWFRSQDGIRSFIVARRNFNSGWGNTPMSLEMLRVLSIDSPLLLSHCSSVLFENRLLTTCSPRMTSYGVTHKGLAVLIFDEISGMFNKSNPAWDGLWTGLSVFQMVKGRLDGTERAWAICCGTSGETELWEVLRDGPFDQHTEMVAGVPTAIVTPISSFIETRSFNFGNPFELKLLLHPVIQVSNLSGSVTFQAHFTPDQHPCWVPWHRWTECNKNDQCDETCGIPLDYKPGYRPFMRLPEAPDTCLPIGTPANLGYEFQLRLGWTGKSTIKRIILHAKAQLDAAQGECR